MISVIETYTSSPWTLWLDPAIPPMAVVCSRSPTIRRGSESAILPHGWCRRASEGPRIAYPLENGPLAENFGNLRQVGHFR